MLHKLLNLLFWLGLALAFGGTIAIGAVAAPAVFSATRDAQITMPNIASPPLDLTTQAGGEIFGTILNRFATLEGIALTLIFLALAGWIVTARAVPATTWFIVGAFLFVVALTLYDNYLLRPDVWSNRQTVRNEAPAHATDTKDTPWPARDYFDSLHHRSELVGKIKAYALLAILLTAAWRNPGARRRDKGSLQDAMRTSRRN